MENLAPIALFVYRRPQHTQEVLKALSSCDLAAKSTLYIFSDGPKGIEDIALVEEVRKAIRQNWGFAKIHINELVKNQGLALSIQSGIDFVLQSHNKIIVLEDDILVSKAFLTYMNLALQRYKDHDKVWHISGWNYPIDTQNLPDTFLWRAMNCWGWATWKNKWVFYKKNSSELLQSFTEKDIYHFNINGTIPFWDQVIANNQGSISTWAIFWYATLFRYKGLCLNPSQSYVQNIGFDGTGENCPQSLSTYDLLCQNTKPHFPEVLEENPVAILKIQMLHKKKPILMTQSISSIFKSLFHRLAGILGFQIIRISKDSWRYLLNTPRFQKMTLTLEGAPFTIADSHSFYWSYQEIFCNEIYKFNAQTPNPTIIDCGSNYGTSILYFKKIYPNALITGVEADPSIFSILQENMRSRFDSSVHVIHAAVANHRNNCLFYPQGADGGRIQFSTGNEPIQVKGILLDDLICSHVDLLKIDIEGAETDAILSCSKLQLVERIFIEYHSLVNHSQTLDLILQKIKSEGFRTHIQPVVVSKQPFMQQMHSEGMDMQLNIFATRERPSYANTSSQCV